MRQMDDLVISRPRVYGPWERKHSVNQLSHSGEQTTPFVPSGLVCLLLVNGNFSTIPDFLIIAPPVRTQTKKRTITVTESHNFAASRIISYFHIFVP